jgi:hypothetical protein
LYPLGNDIFCDEIFHQRTQPRKIHDWSGEAPRTPSAIDNGTPFTRDPYLAVVETGPDLRYDYPPMLEALVQLGFLREYDMGVFSSVPDPQLRRKAISLGALAMQGLHHGLEDVFLQLLNYKESCFSGQGQKNTTSIGTR